MRELFARYRDTATTAGFLVLLVAFIGTVLVPGYRLANDLAANSAALKLVSEQSGQPEVMTRLLSVLRDQLRGSAYVGQSLKDLKSTATEYDAAMAQLGQTAARESPQLAEAGAVWASYRALVAPVAGFAGIPYSDSDTGGTRMNAAGRQLLDDALDALTLGRKSAPQLTDAMTAIGARLERDVADGAATLRKLMIAGVAFACVLVALLAVLPVAQGAPRARRARGAEPDARHPGHRQGGPVPDRRRLPHRQGALRRACRRCCAATTFDGMTFEDLLLRARVRRRRSRRRRSTSSCSGASAPTRT